MLSMEVMLTQWPDHVLELLESVLLRLLKKGTLSCTHLWSNPTGSRFKMLSQGPHVIITTTLSHLPPALGVTSFRLQTFPPFP